jgi:hypothetical protein
LTGAAEKRNKGDREKARRRKRKKRGWGKGTGTGTGIGTGKKGWREKTKPRRGREKKVGLAEDGGKEDNQQWQQPKKEEENEEETQERTAPKPTTEKLRVWKAPKTQKEKKSLRSEAAGMWWGNGAEATRKEASVPCEMMEHRARWRKANQLGKENAEKGRWRLRRFRITIRTYSCDGLRTGNNALEKDAWDRVGR